jgi:chemotaxis protein MotB
MADHAEQPIVIKKIVTGHGHHGGAWKVAYADFVTAMMALFIVLWLMSASDRVKKAVAMYFLDPKGAEKKAGSGMGGNGESILVSMDDLNKLQQKLEEALRRMPEIEKLKNQVTMTVTGEGLRIELLETSNGMFFDKGDAQLTPVGVGTVGVLAKQLAKLPNTIVIEGHTDSRAYADAKNYSNWELSTDRANEARRVMEAEGLRIGQIKQVRGFADQNLRNPKDPMDASNRRVSVIVQYQQGAIVPAATPATTLASPPGKAVAAPAPAAPVPAKH